MTSSKSLDALAVDRVESKRAKADAAQKIKGINDLLSAGPDLLRTLFRFVPNEFAPYVGFHEGAARNREVKDIIVVSRFKLRNVCRIWHSLAETQVVLSFDHGEGQFWFTGPGPEGILIAIGRPLHKLNALPTCTRDLLFKTIILSVSKLDVVVGVEYDIDDKRKPSYPSVAFLLQRIAQTIRQQCRLSLTVEGCNVRELSSFVKQYGVPFQDQVPNIALEKLKFRGGVSEISEVISSSHVLKHFLEFSLTSLVELDVELPFLTATFTGQSNANQYASRFLPEEWACSSLRTLKLYNEPMRENGEQYDYNDAVKRAAAHAALAKLPRRFPRITKLKLRALRPQLDFAVVNQFADLHTFGLHSSSSKDQLSADCILTPFPNIDTFRIESSCCLPLRCSVLLPNVKTVKMIPAYAAAFADFIQDVSGVENCFERLQTVVLKPAEYGCGPAPSFTDLIRLLRCLDRLPNICRLEVGCDEHDSRWSPSGDLSLVQVLPKRLASVSFVYALRPSGVVRPQGSRFAWALKCQQEVPQAEESIYKDWLRSLLCHIYEHPSLEHFHCLCVAPGFGAIYALAERWNRSSAAAIAELGFAFLLHVQCKSTYTRMIGARVPQCGDRFKFRFVLTPRAELTGAVDTPMKRKFVTVEFHNPTK